jgi:hypothetical protein
MTLPRVDSIPGTLTMCHGYKVLVLPLCGPSEGPARNLPKNAPGIRAVKEDL